MDVDQQNVDDEPPDYSRKPTDMGDEEPIEEAFGGNEGADGDDEEAPF